LSHKLAAYTPIRTRLYDGTSNCLQLKGPILCDVLSASRGLTLHGPRSFALSRQLQSLSNLVRLQQSTIPTLPANQLLIKHLPACDAGILEKTTHPGPVDNLPPVALVGRPGIAVALQKRPYPVLNRRDSIHYLPARKDHHKPLSSCRQCQIRYTCPL